MTAAAVAVEHLRKRNDDRAVVDDVSFTVAPGELVALLGPNGAGKTTTVEIVEGYRRADDGIAIVGVLTDDPAPLARDFVAEFGATWPTVEDPDKAFKTTYRVLGRPQTFFIDGSGVVRSVQIGEVRATDFETHYARIAP